MDAFEKRIYLTLANGENHELDQFCRGHDSASEDELDHRDKAFAYGYALALARSEGLSDAVAFEAAEEAWRRWNSPPTRRDIREIEAIA